MVEKLKKLKSLKGRSLRELRVRGAQQLAAARERLGVSSQVRVPADAAFFKLLAGGTPLPLHSAEDLLRHFRTRSCPRFFAAFYNRDGTVAELRRRFGGQAEERVLERAERILEGRFDLLGFHDLSFGNPVDWHLEPVAGKRAPLAHWSRIDYLSAEAAGDKKIIWELNRQQYFMTLGRAYWRTGDERYAIGFAAHLSEWMDANPPKQGINWASSLEVAFRSISWLWAFNFFKDSEHLKPCVFLRAMKFLYLHARHLETYLSTYFSPNTHLTGEALGLFYLGTLLPEFRRAARWREVGRRILMTQLDRHVLADGVYFEQTSYYHRYTTDFYTHLCILSAANDGEGSEHLKAKLAALLDHLMYITRPDGTTPLFGDDDGGRLVKLDERAANDFRAALSTGAVLFKRGDYRMVAGELAEETLWLLGAEGARAFDELKAEEPEAASRAFTTGGYYVMRDGWAGDANYLLIDCGAHGTLNCGHAHADALSLDVAARGRRLLVDAGTFTYTGSKEARDLFRSSLSHNTLSIDDESSSAPAGPFTWRHVANARARRWISARHFDFFEGEHDGYMRLTEPAMHARAILFIKNRYWIMRDRVESEGEHLCELRFHYTSDARPLIERDREGRAVVRERRAEGAGLEIFAFDAAGRWREEEGWVSEVYGARRKAPIEIFSAGTKGAHQFITFLVPRSASEARANVREVDAASGRAFEVLCEEARDLLLINQAGASCSASPASSDFEWAWLRFATGAGDRLKEVLLLNGQRLSINGRETVRAEKRFGYLSARRVGCELIVETDAVGALAVAMLGARRLILNGAEFEARGLAALYFKDGSPVRAYEQEEQRAEDFCLRV